MKIATIIVDDDIMQRMHLHQLLTAVAPEINVVANCASVPEAVEAIRILKPQLVLLDIMLHPYTGFDLLDNFIPVEFEVVFTTTFNDYALRAIKVSAVDYLLKPFGQDELLAAIQKVKAKIQAKEKLGYIELLLQNISRPPEKMQYAISTINGYSFVEAGTILAIESGGKFNLIHVFEGEALVTNMSITELENILPEKLFFRSAKNYLINLSSVKEYHKSKEQIVLKNGMSVKLSRLKKEAFLMAMRKYYNS